MINTNQFPPKDPDEILDYVFDWASLNNNTGSSNWLEDGETIVSHEVTVPTGLTLVSSSVVNNTVVAWLSGGTVDIEYTITCKITTATRTGVRNAILPIKKR